MSASQFDQLLFLVVHFSSSRILPDHMSTLRRAQCLRPRRIPDSDDRFRQHVVVAVAHQMHAGDAFDLAQRPDRFDAEPPWPSAF